MQTGSSGILIGWKSGQTTFVPLWDRMEGAWLRTLVSEPQPFEKYEWQNRARIFQLLRSLRIDSKVSILPAYMEPGGPVRPTLFLLGS